MTELMDYVDDNNNIIGQEDRDLIKEKKLNYRIAHVWIINSKNELLICKRPLNVKAYPGLWTSTAGGHVETKETYEQAAKRESEEEIGVSLDLEHAFMIKYPHPRRCFIFIDLWVSRNYDQNDFIFDATEISETKFISFNNLNNEIKKNPEKFNPEFILMVDKFNKNNK